MTKTPEQMAEEWLENRKAYSSCIDNATRIRLQAQAREGFLAGYHTAYNIAYELGFEEALKAQKTLTYIQAELKKTNENT